MLINSPRVCAQISQDVINTADPAERWLYFLKDHKYLENYMCFVEDLGNGQTAGNYSGVIKTVTQRSLAVCIECEASEIDATKD